MKTKSDRKIPTTRAEARPLLLLLGLLAAVLLLLFARSFVPDRIVFSNDGPLGANSTEAVAMPSAFVSMWFDLNFLGQYAGSFLLPVTGTLVWLLGPVGFAKFYVPIVILMLGCSAGIFFRQLRLSPFACVLGGLATALNSGYFGVACWGVGSHLVAASATFLAMAAVVGVNRNYGLIRLILAGFAVGLAVIEAADIGALYSLFAAAFAFYYALIEDRPLWQRVVRGVGRVAVIAVFAVFIAAQSVTTLFQAHVEGIAGMEPDTQTPQEQWEWATQWSLPKREALTIVIPGLFGYRMDTPDGGNYWGAVGRDPAWDRYLAGGGKGDPPGGTIRFSGGGNYAGVLVVLVGIWAAGQSFRRRGPVFADSERRLVWFWGAAVLIALLFAFGRFAPFYKLIHPLPFFSTIRNPTKFMHILNFSIGALFAFGVHGLSRRYLETAGTMAKGWWSKAASFDRKWIIGMLVFLGASAVGWIIYANSRTSLEAYLDTVQLGGRLATDIAKFSIKELGWFVLLLAASVGVVTWILSGGLAGRRARWAGVMLGLILVIDLGRANLPWIVYWNYHEKYETSGPNPVIKFLQRNAHEQRVALLPEWFLVAFRLPEDAVQMQNRLNGVYGIEWKQHLFLYYNIQTLDIIQMPRVPTDIKAFREAMSVRDQETLRLVARQWELTNTRYILGLAGFEEFLNNIFDPQLKRFRVVERFDLVNKPGVTAPQKWQDLTAVLSPNGAYGIIEFTGALPRAGLYQKWQVQTNDQAVLQTLAAPDFKPSETVLVSEPPKGLTAAAGGVTNSGTVRFESYAPKRIQLSTEAPVPSVLLLNDRYDKLWRVSVDGQPADLLRCNFIMRGVAVPAGSHRVEFQLVAPKRALYISFAAMILAIGLTAWLIYRTRSDAPDAGDVAKK